MANKKILAQQNALVEKERLKVLLQMAGAAAHGLNQPLMILLGNLEILELVKEDHDRVMELVPKNTEGWSVDFKDRQKDSKWPL